MKVRVAFVLSLALALGYNARAQTAETLTRAQQWRDDLKTLAQELPRLHKDLFFKLRREEFDRAVAALRQTIPKLNDQEIIVAFRRLVASAGDGHTSIGLSYQRRYPFNLYQFGNDLYVTSATEEYQQLIGARLVNIGNVKIERAAAQVSELIAHENEQWLKFLLPTYLVSADLLYGLRFQSSIEAGQFEFATPGGKKFSLTINAVRGEAKLTWLTTFDLSKTPPSLSLRRQEQFYWYEYLAEARTLYLNYNRCQEMKDRPFKAFAEEALSFVEANPVEKFVIDLRRNSGGNEAVFFPLLLKLRGHPKLDHKGKLFVIIGRRTFSSGFGNARSLQSMTSAIMVGEPTGQKPNAFGEVRSFQLPHSKLLVNYSTRFWQRMAGDPKWLAPDIFVEPTFAEYAAGRDPVLEAILKYQPQ